MSRVKRFAASMVSGYLALGANVAYTFVSIPLALIFLGKEEFGLWALVLQICSYLALVDFGMSTALARILGDYKDDKDGGEYGSMLKTAAVAAWIQAGVMGLLGIALAQVLSSTMDVPDFLQGEFRTLMCWQSLILAANVGFRTFSAPLWCHQRIDITNYTSTGNLLIMLGVLWVGLHYGGGLTTMLWSSAAGVIFNVVVGTFITWKLGFLPSRGCWGQVSWLKLKELLGFSRDIFLLAIGSQLVNASQLIVITHVLGLDMAAVWAVGTKVYQLMQQFVGRIFDFSAPALMEMFVRVEKEKLEKRFKDLLVVCGATAVLAGSFLAVLNSDFVGIWTQGKIHWSSKCDILLFFLLFVTMVSRCHTGLVGITKEIQNMRYVYMAEGLVFVGLSLIWTSHLSLEGMILAAIIANLSCCWIYGAWRTSRRFNVSFREAAVGWLSGPLFYLLWVGVPLSILVAFPIHEPLYIMISVKIIVVTIWSFSFGWAIGLNATLRTEIKAKLARLIGNFPGLRKA